MNKFIEITDGQDGNIIWIENTDGVLCGICPDQTVIDVDGIPRNHGVFVSFDDLGIEMQQDWRNEQTFIELEDEHGENFKIVFSAENVEVVAI